jgi:CheY-like chemotaxis protein
VNDTASHRRDGRRARAVRVMIVDDQPVFLDVARTLIEVTPGFKAVAQARSGRDALDLAAAAEPDLVVLDVRMAGLDGIETARRLHADYPAMIVLLVSSDLEPIEPLARSCGATALARKQDLPARAAAPALGHAPPPPIPTHTARTPMSHHRGQRRGRSDRRYPRWPAAPGRPPNMPMQRPRGPRLIACHQRSGCGCDRPTGHEQPPRRRPPTRHLWIYGHFMRNPR